MEEAPAEGYLGLEPSFLVAPSALVEDDADPVSTALELDGFATFSAADEDDEPGDDPGGEPGPGEGGPRLVFLASNLIEVDENTPSGVVEVTILRTGPLDGIVDVTYRTFPITATDGEDFIGVAGVIRFEDGESEKSVAITIIDDDEVEGPESFTFVLELAEGAALGVPRTAEIIILDDDSNGEPPPPPVDGESYGFAATVTTVLEGLDRPVSLAWLPGDPSTMMVSLQAGKILAVRDGELLETPVLDIREQVNFTNDRGLVDFAFHPDFENNPYLYVAYVYDPPETADFAPGSLAGPDGQGNRPGRISRFEITLDLDGIPSAIPGSEVVLIGSAGVWENISGPNVNSTNNFFQAPSGIDPVTGENLRDYIAVDSVSHGPGALRFGPDGMLYATIGDGTSFNFPDPRTVRVQDIDNLSGKLLRVDPLTGQGLADNPFFDGDPDSNASKVYQLGLRNAFRMTIDDETGQVWLGDVGWFSWERLLTGEPGANFGWPFFEGGDGVPLEQSLYGLLPSASAFYQAVADGDIVITAPYRGFSHSPNDPGPQFAAIILGDIYRGDVYPEVFLDDIFFADFLSGTIYTMDVNDPDRIVRPLTQAQTPSDLVLGPDGFIYIVSNFGGTIQRLEIFDESEPPPPALPVLTFSQETTPTFEQDRTDSFTTISPMAGQFWQITGAELALDGVAPEANVQLFMTLDDVLLISLTQGFGSVNNLLVTDEDGVRFFAADFRDVEVVSSGGPNLVVLDGTQRGRITFGDDDDVLVISVTSDAAQPFGAENSFTVDVGGGTNAMLFTDRDGTAEAVITAGAGDDTLVIDGGSQVRMTGGAGNDIMVLGTGAHTLVFRPGDGQDIVGNFTPGRDIIEFDGVDPASVTFEFWAEGGGTLVRYGVEDEFIALVGTPFTQFSSGDFLFV